MVDFNIVCEYYSHILLEINKLLNNNKNIMEKSITYLSE